MKFDERFKEGDEVFIDHIKLGGYILKIEYIRTSAYYMGGYKVEISHPMIDYYGYKTVFGSDNLEALNIRKATKLDKVLK